MAADKEENVLDLLSHFIFLKETPKAFWGKPKAPGSVSASVGTRLLMFVGSGFASPLQRPSESCFKKPFCALFFCSVAFWDSGIQLASTFKCS